MEEHSTRSQEPARTAQEVAARRSQSATAAAPPSQSAARDASKDAPRLAGQLAGLGTETMNVWTDAAQHATRNVLEFSAQVAGEGARQLTEWQRTNLELMRELQGAAFRWSMMWPEFFRDPVRGCHRSIQESLDATRRVFELTQRNAGALAESYQRLERVADTATRTLGETFREASTRMQDVYERSERLRAA
jgi:hypothetical protein